jgi:hypothetical protein
VSVACHNCESQDVWDEEDTVYCTPCSTRTWKSDGTEALRICQECGAEMDARRHSCPECVAANPESPGS